MVDKYVRSLKIKISLRIVVDERKWKKTTNLLEAPYQTTVVLVTIILRLSDGR